MVACQLDHLARPRFEQVKVAMYTTVLPLSLSRLDGLTCPATVPFRNRVAHDGWFSRESMGTRIIECLQ